MLGLALIITLVLVSLINENQGSSTFITFI